MTDKSHVEIYVNRIWNRATFKIESEYYLELLTLETMKLRGSTEEKMTNNNNGENVPHLENIEVILVHYNIINNKYQRDLWILSTFVPNKSFAGLSNILPTNHICTEIIRSKFS